MGDGASGDGDAGKGVPGNGMGRNGAGSEAEGKRAAGKQPAVPSSLSRKMMVLRYWNRKLGAALFLLAFGLSFALAGLMLDQDARRAYREGEENAAPFDPEEPGGYSYVRLQYMTDSFVEHVETEENYYFGFDFMFRPYIISMKGEVPGNMAALIDYTYGDGPEDPPPEVEVYGYGKPIIPEMLGYAREYYSQLWQETQLPMTMEELSRIVGDYYLDTVLRTYFQQNPWAVLFYVVPGLILAYGAVMLARYLLGLKAQYRYLALGPGELEAADQELQGVPEAVKGSRAYLTRHYIVTSYYQFDVIPYSMIRCVEMAGGFVAAITKDGRLHIVSGGWGGERIMEMLREKPGLGGGARMPQEKQGPGGREMPQEKPGPEAGAQMPQEKPGPGRGMAGQKEE